MRPPGRSLTLLVSLLALAGLLAAPAAAAQPQADRAGASPRLKYLPKDYWLVAECDCHTVMKFANSPGARQNPQYAQFQENLEMIKRIAAIDLEKDLDWITLFVVGAPGEKARVLAVVQGSFQNDVVEKRLASSLENALTKTTYKDRTIYRISDTSLCFPEDSTMLVGEEALVRAAIAQVAGGPKPLPGALKQVLDRTSGKSVVWVAFQPQALLDQPGLADWRAGNGPLAQGLQKIDCLSLSFDMAADGLVIKGLGYVAAPGEARKLNQYLGERRKELLHEKGSNVFFAALLILSEVKASGPFIEGSFRLNAPALGELWETKVIVRPESGDKPDR